MKIRTIAMGFFFLFATVSLASEQSLSAGYGCWLRFNEYGYRSSQFIEYSLRGPSPFGYSLRLVDRVSLPDAMGEMPTTTTMNKLSLANSLVWHLFMEGENILDFQIGPAVEWIYLSTDPFISSERWNWIAVGPVASFGYAGKLSDSLCIGARLVTPVFTFYEYSLESGQIYDVFQPASGGHDPVMGISGISLEIEVGFTF